jgi:hypothetical protein
MSRLDKLRARLASWIAPKAQPSTDHIIAIHCADADELARATWTLNRLDLTRAMHR